MPLPVAGEVHRLAALHRQSGNAAHLIAIRDAAIIDLASPSACPDGGLCDRD
jgi:hypothetical protein